MNRGDVWMAEAVRLQKENEQLKSANRELLECVDELEEEIRLLKGGLIDGGVF
jgi:cell division protein FtsB